jgi:hypothetical protein
MFRLSVSHLQASFVQMTNYMLKLLRIMGSHTALQVIKMQPLGYRIKFHLPFNNIKWLSDYSRRWQVKGLKDC